MRDFEHVHVSFVDSPVTARLKGKNVVASIRPPFGTDHDLQLILNKRDNLNKQRCNTAGAVNRPVNNVIVDRYPTITNLKDHYSSLTKKEFKTHKITSVATDKTRQLEHIEKLLSPKKNDTTHVSSNRRQREGSYSLPSVKRNTSFDEQIRSYKPVASNDEYDRFSKSSPKTTSSSRSAGSTSSNNANRRLARKTY